MFCGCVCLCVFFLQGRDLSHYRRVSVPKPTIKVLILFVPPPPKVVAPRLSRPSRIVGISELDPELMPFAWAANSSGGMHPVLHPGARAPVSPTIPPTKARPRGTPYRCPF